LLINVYRDRPTALAGTRMMETQLGILGLQLRDPLDARRVWRIESVYLPVPGRVIGGIRAKVRDQKDFVSFCNQRDLEVLLGDAQPGELCPWLDDGYVAWNDDDWVGLACDDEDLRDDLYEREWQLRKQLEDEYLKGENPTYCGVITNEHQLARRVHLGHHYDVEDLFVPLGDFDPETGAMPDTRFETLERRWMRAERRRVRWEKS
jgi:hypothetical protein